MHKTKHRSARHSEYNLLEDLERIKSALSDATYDVKGKAGEFVTDSLHDMKEKTEEWQKGFTHYVTKKPFTSLGIAVGVGAVIGFFLHK